MRTRVGRSNGTTHHTTAGTAAALVLALVCPAGAEDLLPSHATMSRPAPLLAGEKPPAATAPVGASLYGEGVVLRAWQRAALQSPGDGEAYAYTGFSVGTDKDGHGMFAVSSDAVASCAEIFVIPPGSSSPAGVEVAVSKPARGVTILATSYRAPPLPLSSRGARDIKSGATAWIFGLSAGIPIAAVAHADAAGYFGSDKTALAHEWRIEAASALDESALTDASFVADGALVADQEGAAVGIIVADHGSAPLAAPAESIRMALAEIQMQPPGVETKVPVIPSSLGDNWPTASQTLIASGSLAQVVCAGKDWRRKAFGGR